MDSRPPYLPEEIILNILKRLPVESLIRFQCVCKHWNNLIKSPSFIADHLQQSSHQNPSLLLDCNNSCSPLRWRLRLLDWGMQVRLVQKAPLVDSFWGASIIGSCNGLVCVQIHQHDKSPPSLSLWNPATTAVRHVPRPRIIFSDLDDCMTGFGFSPIVNDYKIVRTYSKLYYEVDRAEVFSLSRGSWKRIDSGNLKGVRLNSEAVTTNGAIFWSGVKLDADEDGEDGVEVIAQVIVSFDIVKEVFTLSPWPDLNYTSGDEKLTIYGNKLAILCDIWRRDNERFDLIRLWVMEEGTCAFGERRNWTKIYTSPFSKTLDPVTIWRNQIVYTRGGSAVPSKKGRTVHLMNLTTNEVKRFVVPYRGSIQNIYNYVESLVSVGNNYIEES
ncbi:F-box protein At3g07870-like [Neltuma alba]|uniref:F-box protein At3g07870-like n=1 Tax=Neltuma alba TaxID=207710 RepID=UPI0010A51146|nr:F-box protein At3g07870-like [Prosopis alba]